MSKALVTVSEAMAHLRLDETDPLLDIYIEAASEFVLSLMGDRGLFLLDSAGDVPADSSGPIGVPGKVKAAVLIMMARLYEQRTAEEDPNASDMARLRPPSTVMWLLRDYYDPALA